MFLENFSNDKTPAMLLKELGSLKMEGKEKVKDFDQRFTCILKKFAVDTKAHDSIIVDYYTSALPTNIAQFVKRVAKPILLENCEEAIVVKKGLHVIGLIKDDEPQMTPKMRAGSPKKWRAKVETRTQIILKPSPALSRT